MPVFKNLVRAFVPGAATAERRLKEVAVQTDQEDEERVHQATVRGFERRTDAALAEGRTLAAEFNLAQMKRAIGAAQSGQVLSGPQASRAIEGPPRSMPMIAAPADHDGVDYGQPPALAVSDGDVDELAARFARLVQGISDPAERQRTFHGWSRDLRTAMPELQAAEVERKARAIINSYR